MYVKTRYRHPEVKEKNRERERQRRETLKKQGEWSSSKKGPTLTTSAIARLNQPATRLLPSTIRPELNHLTHPADFFQLAPVFDQKTYNEAVNSLTSFDDNSEPPPDALDELDRLVEYRANVMEWARGWGGVTFWNIGLDTSFTIAVEERRVEKWREQLNNHAILGRKILGRLHKVDGRLPKESWKLRELWRLKIELVEILAKGLTILEIKTSILPGTCTVTYNDKHTTFETDSDSAFKTDSDGAFETDSDGAFNTDSDGPERRTRETERKMMKAKGLHLVVCNYREIML